MGNIWETLEEFEDYIFNNEESFIKEFCKGDVMTLLTISFNSTSMHMVYVLDCGQHIGDQCLKTDFLKWYNRRI